MKPMLTEAAALKVRMPWERGLRRDAMITRRETASLGARAAALIADVAVQEAALMQQITLRRAV